MLRIPHWLQIDFLVKNDYNEFRSINRITIYANRERERRRQRERREKGKKLFIFVDDLFARTSHTRYADALDMHWKWTDVHLLIISLMIFASSFHTHLSVPSTCTHFNRATKKALNPLFFCKSCNYNKQMSCNWLLYIFCFSISDEREKTTTAKKPKSKFRARASQKTNKTNIYV